MPACTATDTQGRQLLTSGAWNAATSLHILGGNVMHFEITNINVVGTSITVVATNTGESHSAVLPLPGLTVDFEFYNFGVEPTGWLFEVSTDADAFVVGWCLWSSWVPTVPVVAGLSASEGVAGDVITVSGAGLGGATDVRFGGNSGRVTYLTDTNADVQVPAGAGTVNVTVVTPAGTSAGTPADQFTYLPIPAISGISPSTGVPGDQVTVSGTGLTGITDLAFGPQSVNPMPISDTQLTVIAPSGAGTVDITVTNRAGTSPVTGADQFTYLPIPQVTGVTPASGMPGDQLTVSGTGFVELTDVSFGPVSVFPNSINDTSLTLTAPGGAGTVDIVATNRAGTSSLTAADQFTYTA